ncbi:MAG: DUF4399 domain-containing protein [Thiotrichales bacterium]
MKSRTLLLAALLLGLPALAVATQALARSPAPPEAQLYIAAPADGATVSSPVTVVFGLQGMGVAPAGVTHPKTGHHHLLINADPPALDQPIPNDKQHLHFGAGQTETRIDLPPGRHTLQLILGDHQHVPHEPPVVSEKISITVK